MTPRNLAAFAALAIAAHFARHGGPALALVVALVGSAALGCLLVGSHSILAGAALGLLAAWGGPDVAVAVFGCLAMSALSAFRAGAFRAARRSAERDPLTGLLNRRGLRRATSGCLDAPLAVLSLDCDGFKRINDSLGHSSGDRALRAVATAAHSTAVAGEFVARIGGDEFALVLPGHDGSAALARLDALRRALDRACRSERFTVTLSAGIALLGRDGDSVEELLDRADRRMVRARAVVSAYDGVALPSAGL
jgi:diguanylate cyclase (GGDEF)-like protein